MSSWQQHILNASVSVNRSVFEMNRPEYLKTDSYYKAKIEPKYIEREVREAIKDLSAALVQLEGAIDFENTNH